MTSQGADRPPISLSSCVPDTRVMVANKTKATLTELVFYSDGEKDNDPVNKQMFNGMSGSHERCGGKQHGEGLEGGMAWAHGQGGSRDSGSKWAVIEGCPVR